jgi:hypothetical protein
MAAVFSSASARKLSGAKVSSTGGYWLRAKIQSTTPSRDKRRRKSGMMFPGRFQAEKPNHQIKRQLSGVSDQLLFVNENSED